ncbi:MAG: AtpZ/AtpI family protein [Thermodesulfovibrionales bacterium]|nr:AtpZ/AtpI family protein [Thermodesulfovibrionales bacterium]
MKLKDIKPEKSILRQVFEASTVGIHFVLCMFAGLAIGYGLDYLLNTFPYLSVIFFIMGIIAGFREVFRIAKKAERMTDGEDDRKNI